MNRDILFEEHPYEPVQPGTAPTAGERCSVPRNQREELKEINAGGYPMDALRDFGLLTLAEVAKLLHCSQGAHLQRSGGAGEGLPADSRCDPRQAQTCAARKPALMDQRKRAIQW